MGVMIQCLYSHIRYCTRACSGSWIWLAKWRSTVEKLYCLYDSVYTFHWLFVVKIFTLSAGKIIDASRWRQVFMNGSLNHSTDLFKIHWFIQELHKFWLGASKITYCLNFVLIKSGCRLLKTPYCNCHVTYGMLTCPSILSRLGNRTYSI